MPPFNLVTDTHQYKLLVQVAPGEHVLRMRRPAAHGYQDTGACIKRPEPFVGSFAGCIIMLPLGSVADAAQGIQPYLPSQGNEVMKIQVEIPGRYLDGFSFRFVFDREETVHLDTADKLFVEMIKGAQVQSVQVVTYIADRGDIQTDHPLRPGARRKGCCKQAGYNKRFQVKRGFHAAKEAAAPVFANEKGGFGG